MCQPEHPITDAQRGAGRQPEQGQRIARSHPAPCIAASRFPHDTVHHPQRTTRSPPQQLVQTRIRRAAHTQQSVRTRRHTAIYTRASEAGTTVCTSIRCQRIPASCVIRCPPETCSLAAGERPSHAVETSTSTTVLCTSACDLLAFLRQFHLSRLPTCDDDSDAEYAVSRRQRRQDAAVRRVHLHWSPDPDLLPLPRTSRPLSTVSACVA